MILRDDFTWGIYWELFKLSMAGPQALYWIGFYGVVAEAVKNQVFTSSKVLPWIVATFFSVLFSNELHQQLSFSVFDFAKQATRYNDSINPISGPGENWNPSDGNAEDKQRQNNF
jgi:hypothetical protein